MGYLVVTGSAHSAHNSITILTDLMAPQVGLEPTTLRLTAECSAIELLRNDGGRSALDLALSTNGFYNKPLQAWSRRYWAAPIVGTLFHLMSTSLQRGDLVNGRV